jgi:hypothetical protein
MSSWIPGFEVLEGPDATGVPMRYRARREPDGIPAWIRIDGYDPASAPEARAAAEVYAATALFDHPALPAVLGYGSTVIAGRPFIAFQAAPALPRAAPQRRPAADLLVLLAEIQLAALECGFAGVHMPARELQRLRDGERVEGRRLAIFEYLCEPRAAAGGCAFGALGATEEWSPFTAPELTSPAAAGSLGAAVAYRLAAQIFFLIEGEPPPPDAGARTPADDEDVGRRLARLGLSRSPSLRPPLESYVTLELPRNPPA